MGDRKCSGLPWDNGVFMVDECEASRVRLEVRGGAVTPWCKSVGRVVGRDPCEVGVAWYPTTVTWF